MSMRMTRRELLKSASGAGLVSFVAPMINLGRYRVFAWSSKEYSARAIDLVKRSTVIDMLSPFTLNFTKQGKWFANPETFTSSELPPFKDSGINVFHIAVAMGGPDAYLAVL